MENEKNFFNELYQVNVNDYTEAKDGLTYLSWAYAIAEVCKRYNQTFDYEIKKFGEKQLPYVYDDGVGFMVFTSITLNGKTRECWLPVMDSSNRAMLKEKYIIKTKTGKEITVQKATMFDVNKTIMRCLTKNIAMFGLGLYIYAGEDLPEEVEEEVVPLNIEDVKALGLDEDRAKKMIEWAEGKVQKKLDKFTQGEKKWFVDKIVEKLEKEKATKNE
ncbi:MAG: DUF1071 domain-containing protein [Firmicutes bacterium]|nr:DUF1071 domain-containing protein [Candidatus Caballimonas caccae]